MTDRETNKVGFFFEKNVRNHLCITWTSLAKLLCLEPNELQTLLTREDYVGDRKK